MNQELRNKREELKAISASFRIAVKLGSLPTVNAGLANYYAEQGHTTLKTYRQWQDEGFQVKQGSKALLLWAEPKSYHKSAENTTTESKPVETKNDDTQSEGDGEKWFPVCFVFSNLQVFEISTNTKK